MTNRLFEILSWWRTKVFHTLFPAAALRRNLARDHENEIELHLLAALADKEKTSIDVGANVGSYTGALLPLSHRVIAIEPHPRLARLLRAFPDQSVEVHQAIATKEAGGSIELEVDLVAAREADALGHVAIGAKRPDTRRYAVDAIALDMFVDQPVGFVKIDVEGHELAVLEGARALLREQHPILLIESEARHCEGAPWLLFDYLANFGYSGFYCFAGSTFPIAEFAPDLQDLSRLDGYERRDQSAYVNNFIFVPETKDLEAIRAKCDRILETQSLRSSAP